MKQITWFTVVAAGRYIAGYADVIAEMKSSGSAVIFGEGSRVIAAAFRVAFKIGNFSLRWANASDWALLSIQTLACFPTGPMKLVLYVTAVMNILQVFSTCLRANVRLAEVAACLLVADAREGLPYNL